MVRMSNRRTKRGKHQSKLCVQCSFIFIVLVALNFVQNVSLLRRNSAIDEWMVTSSTKSFDNDIDGNHADVPTTTTVTKSLVDDGDDVPYSMSNTKQCLQVLQDWDGLVQIATTTVDFALLWLQHHPPKPTHNIDSSSSSTSSLLQELINNPNWQTNVPERVQEARKGWRRRIEACHGGIPFPPKEVLLTKDPTLVHLLDPFGWLDDIFHCGDPERKRSGGFVSDHTSLFGGEFCVGGWHDRAKQIISHDDEQGHLDREKLIDMFVLTADCMLHLEVPLPLEEPPLSSSSSLSSSSAVAETKFISKEDDGSLIAKKPTATDIILLTVAVTSKNIKRACPLAASAQSHGWDLYIGIGNNPERYGESFQLKYKFSYARDALVHVLENRPDLDPEKTVVVFVDSFDTISNVDPQVLLQRFNSQTSKFLWSAEDLCFPVGTWPYSRGATDYFCLSLFPKTTFVRPTKPREIEMFVNTGGWVGLASSALESLKFLDDLLRARQEGPTLPFNSGSPLYSNDNRDNVCYDHGTDQLLGNIQFLRHKNKENLIGIDVDSDFFLSDSHSYIREGRVSLQPTKAAYCMNIDNDLRCPGILHFNGCGTCMTFPEAVENLLPLWRSNQDASGHVYSIHFENGSIKEVAAEVSSCLADHEAPTTKVTLDSGKNDENSISKVPYAKKRCTYEDDRWNCQECGERCYPLRPKGLCPPSPRQHWDTPPRSSTSRSKVDGSLQHVLTFVDIDYNHTRQACIGGVLSPSCWDLSRCTLKDGRMRVYIHSPDDTGLLSDLIHHAESRLPDLIEHVRDPQKACLLVVDEDSYRSPEELKASPTWNGGKNHFFWKSNVVFAEHADRPFGKFDFESAALSTSAFTDAHARVGYDVPIFCWQGWKPPLSIQKIVERQNPRRILLSFKGQVYVGWRHVWNQHRWLAAEYWGNDDDVVVDVKCGDHKDYDNVSPDHYTELMMNSKFVFCPGGGGVHSYRFTEALSAGAIPVVTPELLPPFFPEMDWSGCLVRVSEEDIIDLPRRLRLFSSNEIRRRQLECASLFQSAIGQKWEDPVWGTDHGKKAFETTMKVWHSRVSDALRVRATLAP